MRSKGDILTAAACCRPHFHASPPAKPHPLLLFSQTLSSLILPSSLKFKCISHKPHFPVCSKHRRHIKAAGRRLPVSVRQAVILRRSADAALLRPVHRLQRIARLPVSAVFHFHKHQVSAIAGDDVDLSLPASEIVSNQLVSLFLQILPARLSYAVPVCRLFIRYPLSLPFVRSITTFRRPGSSRAFCYHHGICHLPTVSRIL